jgi:hypothetical protein
MADNVLRRDVNKGKIVPKGRCLAIQQAEDGNGVGPVYGVKLLSAMRAGGMIQAMPSSEDLKAIKDRHTRVVAGFELLTQHWRDQVQEIERLRGMIKSVICGKWTVTELQEAIGDFES